MRGAGRHKGRFGVQATIVVVASAFLCALIFVFQSGANHGTRHTIAQPTDAQQEQQQGSNPQQQQQRAAAVRVAGNVKDAQDPSVCAAAAHRPHTELWGSVVKSGVAAGKEPGLEAASATECCTHCQKTRGCNVWVWCHNADSCGKQCWLKRIGSPKATEEHGLGDWVPWTSGNVPQYYDREIASLPPLDARIDVVTLTTQHGDIRIRLKPEWSNTSVEFVRRVAQNEGLCTTQCEFYRAEPGFLLQGSLRAFIPPNSVTTPGPKLMERGEIGWAGGSAGPDFFIYLGTEPAAHWKHDHTVWGVVADDESLKVVETIVQLPATAPRPGEMHMMTAREPFEISVASRGATAA